MSEFSDRRANDKRVKDLAAGLAEETRINARDVQRRLLTIYIVGWAALILVLGTVGQNIEATRKNCLDQRAANIQAGLALDYFANSTAANKLLTPPQLAERKRQLKNFHPYVPVSCPGIWPFQ